MGLLRLLLAPSHAPSHLDAYHGLVHPFHFMILIYQGSHVILTYQGSLFILLFSIGLQHSTIHLIAASFQREAVTKSILFADTHTFT